MGLQADEAHREPASARVGGILVLGAEAGCRAGWPARREGEMDGRLLRFAGGHTHHTYSVDVVGPATRDPARKGAACEALYRRFGLATELPRSPGGRSPRG